MIVILTALDLECAAVRAHLTDLRAHHHPAGTVFEVGTLAGRPDCPVALAVIGMGTVNAAAITERAIAEFRPAAVLFVGIAGGLRQWIALGDVVVATRVYAYHGGRIDGEEFLARPQAWDTSHRLVQLAKLVDRRKAWPGADATSAEVHFEPVAAGEVVLNSSTAPERERLRSHYNDAVAVEMESSGVALAGHLHESTPTIAVRGISDLAEGHKEAADSAGWQDIAVRNAAAFAAGLVAAIGPTETARQRTDAPGGPLVRTTHNTGGNSVGDIVSTGPVTIDQRIRNFAGARPVTTALVAVALAVVLGLSGWGAYRVVAEVGGPATTEGAPTTQASDQSTPERAVADFAAALNANDEAAAERLVCPERFDWLETRLGVVDEYRSGTAEEGGVSLAGVTLTVVVVSVAPADRPFTGGSTYQAELAWTHGNLPQDLDPDLRRRLEKPDDWNSGVRREPDGRWVMCG
ncbi:5'-methylthioadenosine/S-adenosylhomocysteine nucleosidase family protein [Actinokineospora fastidiosa]|uniref:Nucleoside phosphorylase domain-containing protein n=1 Tax=Actinokineospora fastidiosa TaxID=1816 RepID=A0A918GIS9_9PSEU|nr:5'-methylthioadenosine/S-adenosylhomocysteine nucleosidase [Actinokineospora fastidiosa]GGS37648.1 hypothetical protein GCM10010171_35680 [Actinokineospora fastidiosa]